MKRIALGVSDYKTIINKKNCYYVDKTLLIKEIDKLAKVVLITRPKRFGKTLNLSMLRYFFEKTEEKNDYLFYNTKIWEYPEFREKQGQYPVMFLSFRTIKGESWERAYANCSSIIANEYSRHRYLLSSLASYDVEFFNKILFQEASVPELENSLKSLTEFLFVYHKKRVIVLIDEQDTPLYDAYMYGYYEKMVGFTTSLFTAVFKDNSFLEQGVLNGILRTPKESIFSGFNNLLVCSLWDNFFSDKFGFTEEDVNDLLLDQDCGSISFIKDKIKSWYNGYTFGNTTIYTTCSILLCVSHDGDCEAYWAGTSRHLLIKKLVTLAPESLRLEMESMFSGSSITKEIGEVCLYPGIENNLQDLWSLLLSSGYIAYKKHEVDTNGAHICELVIPNKEIRILYKTLIKYLIAESLPSHYATGFVDSLITGDIATFSEMLQGFIINNMSIFDFPEDSPEKSYQLVMHGIVIMLSDRYLIRSNRESGLDRYDIMFIPKDKSQLGIIMEFKKISIAEEKSLKDTAEKALKQIKNKEYLQELKAQDIKKTVALAIAFKGKKIYIKSSFL